MKMDINKLLKRYEIKSNVYFNDKKRATRLLNKALKKAALHKVAARKSWKNLILLFQVMRDWLNGDYRDISKSTIIAIIAAILYFVSPIDVIIDIIPFGGLLDDAAVIGFVINQLEKDIEKYRLWKEKRSKD
jgi:uncharacterized membrane protein YkvA (DUF1232 family)